MKITTEFLNERSACEEGMEWVSENNLIGLEDAEFLGRLIESNKLDWANWLIVKVFTQKQSVQYAVYAAETVLSIFEKKYPEDKRPREAIYAAKRWAENPTEENRQAAYAAYAADEAYAARAACASRAAACAARAADEANLIKTLNYGISLLREKDV